MPSIDWLETLFMSRVAIFILLSVAVIWLARNNRRKDQTIEQLTTRLIRLLELSSEHHYRTPEKLDVDQENSSLETGSGTGLG